MLYPLTKNAMVRACAMLALVGCGGPVSEPAPSEPAPSAPAPSLPSAEPTAETNDAPAAEASLTEPPPPPTPPPVAQVALAPVAQPETGLPPVTVGRAIRLEPTLPVTTREVNGQRTASVTLADPTAQANLDAWFERRSFCPRGRVQLAIDGFVSSVCTYSEPAAGSGLARLADNIRITAAGEVERVRTEDLFLPGTDIDAMVRVWADDARAITGEIGFGPTGAIVVSHEIDDELLRLPWRTIAPYIRADGPLGPALAAQGLTLAAPGTSAPPTPLSTNALAAYHASSVMRAAARLPPELRAGSRLHAGSEESALLLPHEADLSAITIPSGVDTERRYPYGALADLVAVVVEAPVAIHESAGPRTRVVGALPPGASAIAAVGPIGARTSELGTGWVLVGTATSGGYVQGRHVRAADGCGVIPGPPGSLGGSAELAPDERYAWTIAPGGGTVALFLIGADCVIGEQARRASFEGVATDLRLVRASAEGPDWLLVVVSAADLASPARTISVFGATPDAPPLFTTTADAPTIRLAQRRGPDRSPGYFPITIASGDTRTWLAWNGGALEPLTP